MLCVVRTLLSIYNKLCFWHYHSNILHMFANTFTMLCAFCGTIAPNRWLLSLQAFFQVLANKSATTAAFASERADLATMAECTIGGR